MKGRRRKENWLWTLGLWQGILSQFHPIEEGGKCGR